MPSSLLVYYANQANNANLAFIPGVTDQLYRTTGNGYIVDPSLTSLGAIFTLGANLNRCQIQSPTLRRVLNKEVKPLMHAMPGAGAIASYDIFMDSPIALSANEELDAQVVNGGAGAEHEFVGLVLLDKAVTPVNSTDVTARFTGTTTLAADAWTLVPLTSDQTLQPGTYDVVGARCKSAGGVFFRLVFSNQINRPGWLATQNDLAPDVWNINRHGGLGVWGTFAFNSIPYVEIFSDSADTAETIDLDLVYHPGH